MKTVKHNDNTQGRDVWAEIQVITSGRIPSSIETRQLVQRGSVYYSICFVHIYVFYNKKLKNKKIENYIFEDSYQINIPNSASCCVALSRRVAAGLQSTYRHWSKEWGSQEMSLKARPKKESYTKLFSKNVNF